jgi:transposase
LIEREYEIAVSLTTVGRYLKSWGMSPQKPVRRAYGSNDAAIGRWLLQGVPGHCTSSEAGNGGHLLG